MERVPARVRDGHGSPSHKNRNRVLRHSFYYESFTFLTFACYPEAVLQRISANGFGLERDMFSFDRVQINRPDVVHDIIDGEAVIVNLKSGNYYSLEKVGAEVWNLIALGKQISQIVAAICNRYASQTGEIDQSIKSLIDNLLKENLVVPCNGDSHFNLDADGQVEPDQNSIRGKFESPVLQKYTDMQDLLLLDPIHDTDETGWPNIRIEKNE